MLRLERGAAVPEQPEALQVLLVGVLARAAIASQAYVHSETSNAFQAGGYEQEKSS